MAEWRGYVLAILVGLVGARSELPTIASLEVPPSPVQAVKADRADRTAEPAVRWIRAEGGEVAPRPRWVPPLERLRSEFPEQPVVDRISPPQAPAPMTPGDVDQLLLTEPVAEPDAASRVEGAASQGKAEATPKPRVAEADDDGPRVKKRNDVCAQNGGWREDYRKGGHLYWRCRYKE
jgi:hypothetical protein